MVLELSFLERFTSEGRLKSQWQQALAEPNIQIRYAKLRSVQQLLLTGQAKFVHLWLPFLDTFLSPAYLDTLIEADVKEVERMGDFLLLAALEQYHAEEIWRRAINVYLAKDMHTQAHSLLLRMFHTSSVKSEWKDWAAWQLAESHAKADVHLDVYIQYLQSSVVQTYSNQMLTILADVCNVNIDSDHTHLERAKKLATRLIVSGINAFGKWKANAFYTLLIEKKPQDAIELFMQAFTNNEGDNETLCGLVAASIQSDRFEYGTEIVQVAKNFTSPITLGLLTLFAVLQWLNNQSDSKYPPSTAQGVELLKNLGLQKYVGDKIDIVIGKLYLLEGDARRAVNILRPVVARYAEQPQLKYYVTWADLLINDKANLTRDFMSSTAWSGNWTIASLVLDAEPTIAEQHLATSRLKNVINTNHAYAHFIEARLAFVRMQVPEAIKWVAHSGYLEENMESLRIALASAFYRRDTERLAQLIEFSLFYRLPLPDQDLWRGLYEFSTKHNTQGRALLTESYKNFGYRRVALVLAVHYLEWNMLQEAKQFLGYVGTGKDNSKIAMLWAYVEERDGDAQRAVTTYKMLLKQGETRAHYALGNYYLHQAKYEQAVDEFNIVLNEKSSSLPDDCSIIALCASFVIDPKPVDLWYKLESLEPSQRQTWLWWNAFLAQLWYRGPSDVIATCDLMVPMLEYSGDLREAIALEIARVFVHVCFKVTNIEQENKLAPVLGRISLLTNSFPIKHVCQIGITILTQKKYQKRSETNRLLEQIHPDSLSVDPTNGSLALLLASMYIASNQQDYAVELLKKVASLDEREQKLCQIIASILEGQIQTYVTVTPIYSNISLKTKIGYDLLNATIAFMTEHVAEGSKKLFDVLCKDGETTNAIFNMKRVVLYCCAIVAQQKTSSPKLIELLHNLANEVQEGEEIASIARCFTLLGETEYALSTWKRLNRENDVARKLWGQEVTQLLCHVAAKDYDNLKTVQVLREVVYWVSGTEQGKLCNRLANHLERKQAAHNLLTMMFPAMNEVHKVSGRYAYLVEVIGQYPQLREALTKNEVSSVRREWGKVVTQSLKADVRLLHFRAVSYRDYLLSQQDESYEEGDWIKYTLLWVLMLCCEEFWAYFSVDRATSESGARVPLDEIEQDALFYNAVDHIFSLHSIRASQAFAVNNYQVAKTHFLCLDLCQRGEQALLLDVEEQKMKWSFSLYSKRIDWVQARAGKIFKAWTDNLVKEAKKATENVEALINLRVSKDYETGIRILEPFIGLDIPVLRVLTTCLQWYNDWFGDLLSIKEYSSLRFVLSPASPIAIKLIALCTQGEGYKRENQVIAEHFSWQGFISYHINKEQSMEYYQQALIWNPANSAAQSILKDLEKKDEEEDEKYECEEEYSYWYHHSEGNEENVSF